ncbi:hypothetical protein F2Q69_00000926 [Brassica cretica]|uniref:Uncharacterized protein n=1 Tax=Brassica cretica TaxID=69181 RepID=A0A8S9PHZ2_BRACR|nr:hypothetical protein F2Q69_00000926 [Brassica cretica]
MMRIADVLREERVQMKLMEAKFEFEEKHAAVERVKKELRRVLEGKGSSEIGRVLEIIDGSDDDEESDLKSIELNMESGSKWGYVESRRDHRTDSRYVGSGEDDDDPVEKRSVVVDNGERDESLKTLKEYIVSNMRFIGSSSSEQWNHRHLPSAEFVVKKELRRVLEGKGSSEIGRVLEIIDGSDDDEESDLKSIELNMESGSKWGYVESRRDHRTDSRYVGSGEDDDDPVEKRSVVVDNGERDESLKTLKEYIVSNMRFIGSSSSEQWNHRHLPSAEFV